RLRDLADRRNSVIITDENVFRLHQLRFKGWNTIALKPGEAYKVQATVDNVIEQLLEIGADRSWTLIGAGGGVVTDIAGYVASVYLRGIRVGLVPTTLLAMVDAAIGGKNGVNHGGLKNMVGTIRQPGFILFDHSFLKTLPDEQWRNGFAEIIKHAAVLNAAMFRKLEQYDTTFYRKHPKDLAQLVSLNVLLKMKVVMADEKEAGMRRLLNFGHTLGHALEAQYELAHGEAISIGMAFAASASNRVNGFSQETRLISLLLQYGLPVHAEFEHERIVEAMLRDKKKTKDQVHLVLLEKIGRGVVSPVAIKELQSFFT
ncbi:MAG TPA: 3-dehydroquinate synthase, partial [Flavisolibacter sp.]